MPKEKKKNTVAICEELAAPVAREMGLELWDVRFEKEGSGWYLRYFLDKEGGVTIDDCERFPGRWTRCWTRRTPLSRAIVWRYPPLEWNGSW